MSKLKNIIDLVRCGGQVADPAMWKRGHMTVTIIAGLIWAVVGLAGYDHQIGGETVDAVAGGILAGVNWLLIVITSKKVGLRDKRKRNRGQES